MWLRTLQLGQFGIYKKIVSSLFFDVLKGCFEYKKVFLGRIMCPRYMSQSHQNSLVIRACIFSGLIKAQLIKNNIFLLTKIPFFCEAGCI